MTEITQVLPVLARRHQMLRDPLPEGDLLEIRQHLPLLTLELHHLPHHHIMQMPMELLLMKIVSRLQLALIL